MSSLARLIICVKEQDACGVVVMEQTHSLAEVRGHLESVHNVKILEMCHNDVSLVLDERTLLNVFPDVDNKPVMIELKLDLNDAQTRARVDAISRDTQTLNDIYFYRQDTDASTSSASTSSASPSLATLDSSELSTIKLSEKQRRVAKTLSELKADGLWRPSMYRADAMNRSSAIDNGNDNQNVNDNQNDKETNIVDISVAVVWRLCRGSAFRADAIHRISMLDDAELMRGAVMLSACRTSVMRAFLVSRAEASAEVMHAYSMMARGRPGFAYLFGKPIIHVGDPVLEELSFLETRLLSGEPLSSASLTMFAADAAAAIVAAAPASSSATAAVAVPPPLGAFIELPRTANDSMFSEEYRDALVELCDGERFEKGELFCVLGGDDDNDDGAATARHPITGQPISHVHIDHVFGSLARPVIMSFYEGGAADDEKTAACADERQSLPRCLCKRNEDIFEEICAEFSFDVINALLREAMPDELHRPFIRTFREMPGLSTNLGFVEIIEGCEDLEVIENDGFAAIGDPARFVRSMCGAALAVYTFGISDRHRENTLVHVDSSTAFPIDFGFMLGLSAPSTNAYCIPFSSEFFNFMLAHGEWPRFAAMFLAGFLALRERAEVLITVAKLCFLGAPERDTVFVERFISNRLLLHLPGERALAIIMHRVRHAPVCISTAAKVNLHQPNKAIANRLRDSRVVKHFVDKSLNAAPSVKTDSPKIKHSRVVSLAMPVELVDACLAPDHPTRALLRSLAGVAHASAFADRGIDDDANSNWFSRATSSMALPTSSSRLFRPLRAVRDAMPSLPSMRSTTLGSSSNEEVALSQDGDD
jgi:Phosphatidylinositol 3- and 4-kinase